MKPLLKKTLIVGGIVLVPIAVIGASTAAYFSTPVVERISKKGIYQIRINENLNNEGYKYDLSATYGGPTATSRLTYLINNEILHLETSGEFVYDQKTQTVKQPSYEAYKFANADSIVLTFIKTDVTKEQFEQPDFYEKNPDKFFQLKFDSDESEITPIPDSNKQAVVVKTSDNPKSINNYNVFGKLLVSGFVASMPNLDDENVQVDISSKNYVLVGMGLTFPGAKWVDSNGNETKYEIKALDMLYSAKRTWLYDHKYRRSNGGSKELDAYFIEKTSTNSRFGDSMDYPNEYLFDFFGVRKDWLYDEKRAIQNIYDNATKELIDESYMMTFNVFANDGTINKDFASSGLDIIKKYLVDSLHFSLAPSEYIDEYYGENSKYNNTPSGRIQGEAAKYGIYTYAQTRETTLFACQYIPVESKSGREIFEYNKYFANKEWIDSVTNGVKAKDGSIQKTINKVIIEYSGAIDSSTFINQSFSAFQNGTLSQVDFNLLTNNQKQKLYGSATNEEQALINSSKNGLQTTKKVNISQLTTRMVWQGSPDALSSGDYTFNDIYSKLVYGVTKDELKSGKAVTSNSFYAGYGFYFRMLVQAAINWNYYIQWAYSGTRDVWMSGAAQNAKFSSTNDKSLTPFDFNEDGMNDLFFYDKDKNIVDVSLKEMKRTTMMTTSEFEKEFGIKDSTQARLQSANPIIFKKVKETMKILLDNFYKEFGIGQNEKITFQIAYPFADQDETKCLATEAVVNQVIRELDPRIDAKFFKPTKREEMLESINQRRGAFNANLWSYDYEGIGSYVSAFASAGGGINISPAISIFSKTSSDNETLFQDVNGVKRPTKDTIISLQEQFPAFTELSKYVRENMNKILKSNGYDGLSDNGKLFVENWDLLTNYDIRHIEDTFKVANIDPVSSLSSIFKAFETDATWEQKATEQEKGQGWVQLIKEINHIKGVSVDVESSVEKLDNVNYALFLREYIVPLSRLGFNQFADIKYAEK